MSLNRLWFELKRCQYNLNDFPNFLQQTGLFSITQLDILNAAIEKKPPLWLLAVLKKSEFLSLTAIGCKKKEILFLNVHKIPNMKYTKSVYINMWV